jgi:hypothetical protein
MKTTTHCTKWPSRRGFVFDVVDGPRRSGGDDCIMYVGDDARDEEFRDSAGDSMVMALS